MCVCVSMHACVRGGVHVRVSAYCEKVDLISLRVDGSAHGEA